MKCLRCGHCCTNYFVVIVDVPELGINEDNLKCKEQPGRCQHLQGDQPGQHSCAIHDESWYKDTPCFEYGQIETDVDTPCRIGTYVLQQDNRQEGRDDD